MTLPSCATSWMPRIHTTSLASANRPARCWTITGERIADGQTWVIEDAGRIVGVVVLEETQAGFLLDNVAVLPGCQGRGHGRALVEFAEAEARRRRYGAIHLYTHALMTENIGLYTAALASSKRIVSARRAMTAYT